MNYAPNATYIQPAPKAKEQPRRDTVVKRYVSLKDRIYRELRALGMTRWGFMKLGTHYLPSLMHENEHIYGVVYGRNDDSSAMLVATETRVIFLDKEPLFAKAEDLTYDIVGGITLSGLGPYVTITLHTRMGDFRVNTFNRHCATHFRNYIEGRCVEIEERDSAHDQNPWLYADATRASKKQ